MKFEYQYKNKIFYNKFDLIKFFSTHNIISNPSEVNLSFQKKIDEYNFVRNKDSDFFNLSIKRLKFLREKYDYLRLWYSGGRDSRYILDLSEYCNVEFDEIFIFDADLFTGGETKDLVFPNHYKIKNKINQVKFREKEYELVWRDPLWYRNALDFSCRSIVWNQNIYKYINPVKKILTCPKNFLDVLGGTTPIIWFDKNWKFVFNEYELDLHLYTNVENFIISDQMPELLESYVNNIATQLENKNFVFGWSDTLQKVKKSLNNTGFLRDTLPYFSALETKNQLAKNPLHATGHNYHTKAILTYQYFEKNKPLCYKLYQNSDWNLIQKSVDFGAIMSKVYALAN